MNVDGLDKHCHGRPPALSLTPFPADGNWG